MPWVVTAVVHLTEPLPARWSRPHKHLLDFKTAAIPAKWQQNQKRCDILAKLNAVKVQLRFPFFLCSLLAFVQFMAKCDEVVHSK